MKDMNASKTLLELSRLLVGILMEEVKIKMSMAPLLSCPEKGGAAPEARRQLINIIARFQARN